jgi:eukaryotic-like serine/threonine-protein kinase
MTPERWQQVDRLFHATLECEPARRREFLDVQCHGDETLRFEVESLISSHEVAESFIEAPAADVAAEMFSAQQPSLAPGKRIGNYRIKHLIGSGGMGEVYLADDTRLHRKIALKLLPPHFTDNLDRVRRFEREARAASSLNHPNIVTIHEIGHEESAHFIATEYVEGKTLRQLITGRHFTLNETLEVAIQIAGALSAAHAAGIVHRDIKPENIMVRADGYVKILDFGLAKLTETQKSNVELELLTLPQSSPGLVMGTVQYMSPEQARGRNVDVRTDIWSLGVVLYELLGGRAPFAGETPSHVMVALMEQDLPALTDYAHVPPELDRIVTLALRKNPKERYQSASQLEHDLKALRQELQLEAHLRAYDPGKPTAEIAPGDHIVTRPTANKDTAPGTQALDRMSSAEYIVKSVNRHKGVVATIALLLVAAIGVTSYWYLTRAPSVHSLAVLPFSSVGNSADLEYLSDGLSESLTNSLSPVPGLKVIARYSSFQYKGKTADPREADLVSESTRSLRVV